MFLFGPFPVRTNTESLTLRRGSPAVANVSVTVPFVEGSGWRVLAVGGQTITIDRRGLGVRFEAAKVAFIDGGCLAVGGRVIRIGGRCLHFDPPAVLPGRGDAVTVEIAGRRVSGVLTDWGYSIKGDSVAEWTASVLDGSYRLLAIVRPSTAAAWGVVSGGVAQRSTLARAVGALVGLVVDGDDQLTGGLDAEPKIGERWLSVWRRVLLGTPWRVEGDTVKLGDVVGRRVFMDGHYSVEALETGRASTVAVHEGAFVAVVGEGLPQEVVEVELASQLEAIHAARPVSAVRVTVTGVDASVDVKVGDSVQVQVPGLSEAFNLYVVDTWGVTVDEGAIPAVTATLLPPAVAEDRAYG